MAGQYAGRFLCGSVDLLKRWVACMSCADYLHTCTVVPLAKSHGLSCTRSLVYAALCLFWRMRACERYKAHTFRR